MSSHTLLSGMAMVLLLSTRHLLDARPVHGGGPDLPAAQTGIVVDDFKVTVDFGQSIKIQARITAPLPLRQVSILLHGVNDLFTYAKIIPLSSDGAVNIILDVSSYSIPPFSQITLWFQVILADGSTDASAPIIFTYTDSRFTWRETGRDSLSVHWVAGDEAFGTSALESASAAMHVIRQVRPAASDKPVDIYIYSNPEDLRDTLASGSETHTHPGLGVVLLAIAPGKDQAMEIGSKVPHELAHVMLYQTLGDGYARQPAWLLEGLACMAETQPNPEYEYVLESAYRKGSLLFFEDLCASFPADAGNAFLAFAQSGSFVRFIRDNYGNAGLTRLIESYQDEFSCALGVTRALGVSLSQLEAHWRASALEPETGSTALNSLAPYLALMALALIIPMLGALLMGQLRRKRGQQVK